jgi:hypothetical protein
VPLHWAETQSNLGIALRLLGEREAGTARLEEAVAAFRAALEVRTRQRMPLEWAETRKDLKAVLQILGQRTKNRRAAVQARPVPPRRASDPASGQ